MIYTSYFANRKHFIAGKQLVCVARYPPYYFKIPTVALELAPSAELLESYKNSRTDEDQYTEIFNKQLAKQDEQRAAIAAKYQECILLCYEKPPKFCHRHLVADWLRAGGHEVQELPFG